MAKMNFVKWESTFGFHQLKFGLFSSIENNRDSSHPIWSRLFMFLNMTACLLLLLPNVVWSTIKILTSLTLMMLIYPVLALVNFFKAVNFEMPQRVTEFLKKETLFLFLDLFWVVGQISSFAIGIFSPSLIAKAANNWFKSYSISAISAIFDAPWIVSILVPSSLSRIGMK